MSEPNTPKTGFKRSLTLETIPTLKIPFNRLNTHQDLTKPTVTEIQIPKVFLINVPANLCPSFAQKPIKKRSFKSKLSLMIDFGLAPDTPLYQVASQVKTAKPIHRTITLSDFMSKKNVRRLFSSHDLGSVRDGLKRQSMIAEYQVKKSLTLAKSPQKMDENIAFRCQTSKNHSRNKLSYFSTASNSSPKKSHKKEINKFNEILQSCDHLLKDNKKTLQDLKASARNLSQSLSRFPLKVRSIIK
ncbi:hypothetical protein SteCoe_22993 [Stentor coeruleus]|uniref:Uncharacterized protein n=1 Tax=Stentor coeruleus TaxID=5963 RepID=A0A1R2BL18_9CILI|nr:hypothetical protein SteCoe_22993 [Stentor coeruleus]